MKVWWNGYHKGAVPIVLGGKERSDYERILPPRSFLHWSDFDDLGLLADLILFLSKNPKYYLRLQTWRKDYRVLNEHGYSQSTTVHYCRYFY